MPLTVNELIVPVGAPVGGKQEMGTYAGKKAVLDQLSIIGDNIKLGSSLWFNTTNGNIGIKTDSPKANLHIVTSGTTGLGTLPGNRGIAITGNQGQCREYFECVNATTGQRVFAVDNSAGTISWGSLNDDASSFLNQYLFNISYDGKIGIGAISTTAKLEITTTDKNALRIKRFGPGPGETGELQFMEGGITSTKYVGFKAPDLVSSNIIWTLPDADSTGTQALVSNGSGVLSWSDFPSTSPWNRITGTPNYVIPATASDDVGATAARINKIWATDLEITNMPSVGGTSINANGVLSLTNGEVTQLANIDTNTISTTQWGYLGELDQALKTTDLVSFAQIIIDNLKIDGNTLESISGNVNITPLAGSSIVLDGAINIDAGVLTGATSISSISFTGELSATSTLANGVTGTTQAPSDNSTKIATTAYVDAAIPATSPWSRVTGTPNYVIPATASDDVGATATRINKIWTTDIESTNMPSVGGTSINSNGVLSLTSGEVSQLASIDSVVINNTQWGYIGAMDQSIDKNASITFQTITSDPFGPNSGNTGSILLKELVVNGTNHVGFKAPDAITANLVLTLPATDSTGTQALVSNGSGVLSWANFSTVTTFLGLSDTPSSYTTAGAIYRVNGTGNGIQETDVISFSGTNTFSFINGTAELEISPATTCVIDQNLNTSAEVTFSKVKVPDGLSASPSFQFLNAPGTGFIRAGTNGLGISIGGNLTETIYNSYTRFYPWGLNAGETYELRFAELPAGGINYVGFKAPDSIATDTIWTLPSADGTPGQILSTNGSKILSWIDPTTSTIWWTRSGTVIKPLNTGDTLQVGAGSASAPSYAFETQANSGMYLGASASLQFSINGNARASIYDAYTELHPWGAGANSTYQLRFLELVANGTNYVGFRAPDAITTNMVWVLPNGDSTGTQALVSNGSSVLSWADFSNVTTFLGLSDTPSSYTSAGGLLRVNGTANGLEESDIQLFGGGGPDNFSIVSGTASLSVVANSVATFNKSLTINTVNCTIDQSLQKADNVIFESLTTNDSIQLNPRGTLAGETGELHFLELAANGTNYIGFKSPDALTANYVYLLPNNFPTSINAPLVSNTAGVLSWGTPVDSGTAIGQMSFWDGFSWSNTETSELFWNDTLKAIGLGTATPGQDLAGGTSDINTNVFHLKNSAQANMILEGTSANLYLIDNAFATVDSRISRVFADNGQTHIASYNQNLSLRHSILTLDNNSGLISTGVTSYEALVISDNAIPNKKYVDDAIPSIAVIIDDTSTDAEVASAKAVYSFANQAVVVESGTAWAVGASHLNKMVEANNASAITVTLDGNLPVNGECNIVQAGNGSVTFVAGGGFTIKSFGGALSISGLNAGVTVKRIDATNYRVIGALA